MMGGDVLNLEFSEERKLLRDSFARFFEEESSIARVRAAEPLGFDPALMKSLGQMGALGIRVPEAAGGSGAGLMDAVLLAEQAGRALASAPLVESIVAARLLAELGGSETASWLEGALSGETVVTLALHEAKPGAEQVVAAGAVAGAVLMLEGDVVSLRAAPPAGKAPPNHGSQPIARMALAGSGAAGEKILVAKGREAREAFLAGVEEWKLLTAAALNGLSRRALEYAVEYARDRIQFGRPIGSYQAIAHPLADRAVDLDCAQLFSWWTIQQIAEGKPGAAADVALSFWLSCQAADETTRRAVHTFGGYGVTLEYDLQLFFRRAKAWPLVLGDPQAQLAEAGARLWLGAQAPLPAAGDPGLDFEFGPEAEALAEETRAVLRPIASKTPGAAAFRSYENYDPKIAAALGEHGLYHPAWPEEWGGRGAHPYAAALAVSTWEEFKIATHPQGTSHFVGSVVRMFGDEMLKEKVVPGMARGEINCALGYSEPGSGSDIFAARTRAEWDEKNQEWVINGQKMFTSGAERTQYIFLLTRTDPEAAKHAGVTMFLVPTGTPGIEIHPVHTMQEERTNATFYADVRVSDLYRVGDINGGARVLGAALVLEQGGTYRAGSHELVDIAVDWARLTRDEHGRARLEDADVRKRIGRLHVNAILKELLSKRCLFVGVSDPTRRNAFGPMVKLHQSEAAQRDLTDLMDLMAPETLFHGHDGLGEIEISHRLAQIGTIYGGTSEVQRSTIAEVGLGLPRSR
jgi:alkylation response protein AidB-like acyl-CoA dehydrogenase